MIIWSGWGILVVVFAVAGAVAGILLGVSAETHLGWPHNLAMAIGWALSGLLAAGMTHAFAKWRESKPNEVFVHQDSGEVFEVRPNAGSLFFIPMRIWPWILLGFAALASVSALSPSPA